MIAHLVQTGFGAFYDGFAHLWLTPVDLLVVLALGLFAGLRGPATARALLLALSVAWLAGCALGALLPGSSERPLLVALSVALCGTLAAANLRLAREPATVLAVAVGVLHGYVDGATLPGSSPLAWIGAALACLTAVTLCAATVVSLRRDWQRVAVRVAGSWIAAVGVLLVGWQLRE